jgi:solute carrier family 26, other
MISFQAVLASIIVVALRSVLLQILDLPAFWRLSRTDGLLWLAVFLSVVVIDIDYGLLIGFTLSAAKVFMQVNRIKLFKIHDHVKKTNFQGLKAYTCLLGNVPGTDLYLDITRYKAVSKFIGR